jgi:hypothetical protein
MATSHNNQKHGAHTFAKAMYALLGSTKLLTMKIRS